LGTVPPFVYERPSSEFQSKDTQTAGIQPVPGELFMYFGKLQNCQ